MYNIYKTITGRLYCSQDPLDLDIFTDYTFIAESEEYLSAAEWTFDEDDNIVPVIKSYAKLRKYPKYNQQLDTLWHDIDRGLFGEQAKTGDFYQAILAIKQQFPKTDK